MIRLGEALGLTSSFLTGLALALGGCGGESRLVSSETPLNPGDSVAPPANPPAPPPDSTPTAPPPEHHGMAFGPFVYTKGESERSTIPPATLSPAFTALVTVAYPPTLLTKLEEARRTNGRLLLSFAGSGDVSRDSGGFSLTIWKQRVDRFRGFDLSSYIADGTILGHFIMDEPSDPSNWNGHLVERSDIDAMAKYSKEIWPDLPTIIRGWPAYLKGYEYEYLDAAWAQYHVRFGSIDDFIATKVLEAKELGLELVTGLNVVGGGGEEEGMPGYHGDKYAMNPSQVRSWGNKLLAEPYFCAFFMFRYNGDYFSRPDIEPVMAELSEQAQNHPKQTCRRQ